MWLNVCTHRGSKVAFGPRIAQTWPRLVCERTDVAAGRLKGGERYVDYDKALLPTIVVLCYKVRDSKEVKGALRS